MSTSDDTESEWEQKDGAGKQTDRSEGGDKRNGACKKLCCCRSCFAAQDDPSPDDSGKEEEDDRKTAFCVTTDLGFCSHCVTHRPVYIDCATDYARTNKPCGRCLPVSVRYTVFLFITLLVAGLLIGAMYYGADMDVEQSYWWLAVVGLSIGVDIFIVEPTVVFCVAVFCTLKLKALL